MTLTDSQRQRISERGNGRCEYCLLHQDHSIKIHEVDHIIPKKHDGKDLDDNLAWACFHCNRYKGSDVGAYDTETGQLTPLFNPRTQIWHEHFSLDNGTMTALTTIGRVTIQVLQLNRPARIQTRILLAEAGLYP